MSARRSHQEGKKLLMGGAMAMTDSGCKKDKAGGTRGMGYFRV